MRSNTAQALTGATLAFALRPVKALHLSELTEAGLERYLRKIRREFDVDALLSQSITEGTIVDYYRESDAGYRLLHSGAGAIHMALNSEGAFTPDGYYGQARLIEEEIHRIHAREVLEIGAGKAFNLAFLAERNPDIHFVGIELNAEYVAEAMSRWDHLRNLEIRTGNFQTTEFQSSAFDVVFAVESFCHATDLPVAFNEIFRILSPGSLFFVIDGFRKPAFHAASDSLKLAVLLTEHSMAVGNGVTIDDWVSAAKVAGFSVQDVQDLSTAVMPNLLRLQTLGRGYLKFPGVRRILSGILPKRLVTNAIAGVLMPFTVRAGVHGYFAVKLQKPI